MKHADVNPVNIDSAFGSSAPSSVTTPGAAVASRAVPLRNLQPPRRKNKQAVAHAPADHPQASIALPSSTILSSAVNAPLFVVAREYL
jgi:hypothetical protein